MSKIRYGQAEIIKILDSGITLLRFRGRYYTAFGRMFAVAGNHLGTDYDVVCGMKHFGFCDWNVFRDMYIAD